MAVMCPICGGKTKSIDSRPSIIGNSQLRKRECLECKCRFQTSETVIKGTIKKKYCEGKYSR